MPGLSHRARRAIKHKLFSIASEGGQSLSRRPKEGSLDISCAPFLASTEFGAEACLRSDKFSTLNCSVPYFSLCKWKSCDDSCVEGLRQTYSISLLQWVALLTELT